LGEPTTAADLCTITRIAVRPRCNGFLACDLVHVVWVSAAEASLRLVSLAASDLLPRQAPILLSRSV
jgi:hypothetical protein